jgi:hypothetical protein
MPLKINNMTAVEWLLYHFDEIYHIKDKFLPSDWEFLEETSKAMENEQIIDAHIEGQRVFDKHDHTQWTTDQAEQYYNETYKNK